jgi:hypothetical protein
MTDTLTLVAIGPAIAVALFACYRLAKRVGRQRTLRAAEQITHAFASEWALGRARPALRHKLERYRLARVRANRGATSSLHAAAVELVREHRMHVLERR